MADTTRRALLGAMATAPAALAIGLPIAGIAATGQFDAAYQNWRHHHSAVGAAIDHTDLILVSRTDDRASKLEAAWASQFMASDRENVAFAAMMNTPARDLQEILRKVEAMQSEEVDDMAMLNGIKADLRRLGGN
jgi:hypothetical protein